MEKFHPFLQSRFGHMRGVRRLLFAPGLHETAARSDCTDWLPTWACPVFFIYAHSQSLTCSTCFVPSIHHCEPVRRASILKAFSQFETKAGFPRLQLLVARVRQHQQTEKQTLLVNKVLIIELLVVGVEQTCNQLWTPGAAKSFRRGGQIF